MSRWTATPSALSWPAWLHAGFSLVSALFLAYAWPEHADWAPWLWPMMLVWLVSGILGIRIKRWPRWVPASEEAHVLDHPLEDTPVPGAKLRGRVWLVYVVCTALQWLACAWIVYLQAVVLITSLHRDFLPEVLQKQAWGVFWDNCWMYAVVVVLGPMALGHALLVRRTVARGMSNAKAA